MTGPRQSYQTDALFKGLRTLLTSLPSEEEKKELLRTLKETQLFLEELSFLVEAIPTMESSRDLSEGLSRLDTLANRARGDVGLRRILGLRTGTGSSRPPRASYEHVVQKAHLLHEELSHVETSDIVSTLERSMEPTLVFRELARILGIRTPAKERRVDLVRRIANHIENQRGYQLLRGEGPGGSHATS